MSTPSRRSFAKISFDGTDITSSITPYLISMIYTDAEEDEADDLQLRLQDREAIWTESWLQEAIEAAASATLKIKAKIVRQDWTGPGKTVLPCGMFTLDEVTASGPPSEVTIKGTALPLSAQIRQTKKSKAWENYKLSGIVGEMAGNAGMAPMYESKADPFYARVEQLKVSDIEFLSQLCHDAGLSLKATGTHLIVFDQAGYESRPPVLTLTRKGGYLERYKLRSGSAGTRYSSCRVSYTDPVNKKTITGTAKVEDYKPGAKGNQQLEVTAKVTSADEAKALAAKHLRLHNKYEKTATFTVPGNPALAAGVVVALKKFGGWDGRYIVKQARHTVNQSGYTTTITLRRCLEGY